MSRTVDARGQLCPRPLIMTKKALNEIQQGESLTILLDNNAARDNVVQFLRDNQQGVTVTQNGKEFELTVIKGQEQITQVQEDYCPLPTKNSKGAHIISICNNVMGQGPTELTNLLIQSLINTIKEITPLPNALVFYANGIFLTLKDSPALASLQELEKMGIKILVCGTCLEYFGKRQELAVGQISNMYAILETMSNASHIVTP